MVFGRIDGPTDVEGRLVIYDRNSSDAEPPDSVWTELGKLSVDFFNKSNPHMKYSTAAVELVQTSVTATPRGATYHLTFTTKPDGDFIQTNYCSDMMMIPPLSQTFKSAVWYDHVADADVNWVQIGDPSGPVAANQFKAHSQ